MDNTVRELLNQQINQEFFSAYLYLDYACFFEQSGLKGFAKWFRVQALEELCHGCLFIQYLLDCGETVKWQKISPPLWSTNESKASASILVSALQHEQFITGLIDSIHVHAQAVHDLRTIHFLDWFIAEQTEEEQNAAELIQKFQLYGHDPSALYSLDHELGKREYAVSGDIR